MIPRIRQLAGTRDVRLRDIVISSLSSAAYVAQNSRKERIEMCPQSRNVNWNQRLGGSFAKLAKIVRTGFTKPALPGFGIFLTGWTFVSRLANPCRPTSRKTRKKSNCLYASTARPLYLESITYANGPTQVKPELLWNQQGQSHVVAKTTKPPKPECRLKSAI